MEELPDTATSYNGCIPLKFPSREIILLLIDIEGPASELVGVFLFCFVLNFTFVSFSKLFPSLDLSKCGKSHSLR